MIHPPYNFQIPIINSTDKFLIINKSRQIGISLTLALIGLMSAVIEGKNVLIISQSQRLANKVMSYIDSMMDDILSQKDISVSLKKNTTEEKKFYNSVTKKYSEILSVPAKGASARGNSSAVLIMDEVAFWDNDKELYTAVLPSITAQPDYRVILSSSPNGEGNLFHEIFTDSVKYPLYKRISIPINEAMKDERFKPDIESIFQSFDEDSIRQEFYCEFLNNALAFISNELIKRCVNDFDANKIISMEGNYYAGLDIGRSSDSSVLQVIKKVKEKDKFYLIETIEIKNETFAKQREIIESVCARYEIEKLVGDATGIGMETMETLSMNNSSIEGVHMTNEIKNSAFLNLKKVMEESKLIIPPDIELQKQINSIRRKTSINNNTIFSLGRNKLGHSDSCSALIYALHAGKSNSSFMGVAVIG